MLIGDDNMDFLGLIDKVNNFNLNDKNEMYKIVEQIDINENNFNQWVDNIFSDNVKSFDMGKLPYLIDELYQTNDRLKFMLCCMLLESTCDKLNFVTNLENYPVFEAKFQEILNTLVTVYERVDNGIANCMTLIALNNDPEFKYFSDELKSRLVEASKRKLNGILNYLKTQNINPVVYDDLEVIVDLCCYLKNQDISRIIDEIDNLGDNSTADIFIIKYKIINNLNVSNSKIERLKNDNVNLNTLYGITEKLGVNNTYLGDVTQEQIALSNMIRWLRYPTELNGIPDKIELLGEFVINNTKCYAYKFSKNDFSVKGDLLGVSGGYPLDKVSASSTGYTFSKFEQVTANWEQQAKEIVNMIIEYWKQRENN